ncbi:MAG: hypothetical protein ACRD8Z_12445 [Nitrososphaeraceae archaeon]
MVQDNVTSWKYCGALINARPIVAKGIVPQYGYDSESKFCFLTILDNSYNEIDPT